MHLTADEFEDLVVEALDSLPEEILEVMNNVEVTVQTWPSREQLTRVGVRRGTLLGLYEGIPLTKRHSSSYSIVAPDKVTIFQRPIERICATPEEIVGQVRETVIHEIAHHFGIDDDRLVALGW